jgi:hypothetical protein
MKTPVFGALALSLLFTGAAAAQTLGETPAASTFGGRGQVAIAGDFSLRFEHTDGNNELQIAPALDYFIAPQLSLGGQVFVQYAGDDNFSTTAFGIGPRVGYNIPLAPMFSLFPRAGFTFTHVTSSAGSGSLSVSRSANYLGLFLFAPFLFHPVPHFFIGLGPSLSGPIAGGESSSRHLTIALESTVGGYFDW